MKIKVDWLVFFLGIVFLSAALYRIIYYSVAISEFTRLNLPLFLLPITILIEITIGLSFLFNKKVKYFSMVAIIFLIIAIVLALSFYFKEILAEITEIFIFRPNPTDILLHLVYIILLIIIFVKYRKSSS